MSGSDLVSEVKPLTGSVVPLDLYIRALEQVAAPGVTCADDVHRQQCAQRKPPIAEIQVSDSLLLSVRSTVVRKIGAPGWTCTAVVDPSTTRTRFFVNRLIDLTNGVGVAVFDPERVALRGSGGFPNPNQWGAHCLAGIYGTGCFFGTLTDHDQNVRWREGLTIEVIVKSTCEGAVLVAFAARGDGEHVNTEHTVSDPQSIKIAIALYSTDDTISVESAW